MIYAYGCTTCSKEFDVIKSIADFDRTEYCDCGGESLRLFRPNADVFQKQSGIPTEASYNPGLGCVVKDKKHLKEICKQKGVEPIGNDSPNPDSIHKHYEQEREKKREKSYDDGGWQGSEI